MMYEDKNMYNKYNIIIEFTTLFILIGCLNTLENMNVIKLLSVFMLMAIGTLLLFFKTFKTMKIMRRQLIVLICYILFLMFYFIGVLVYPKLVSIKIFLQAFSLINFFLFFSEIDYSECKFIIMKVGISLYIGIFALMKFGVINYSKYWRMYILYPFLMLYFLVLLYKTEGKKIYVLMMATLVSIIFRTSSRSILLVALITVFVYMFWKRIIKNKFRYIAFLLLVFASIFLFMIIYVYWYSNPNSIVLIVNEFSRKVFGKNLYSGRQVLWSNVLVKIKDNLVWGYGTGVSGGALIESGISVHNLYLQLLVQNGILGLGSFLILLISIWMIFWKSRGHFLTRLSASFFIASIVHNTFELILLQNHMSMAFFQWFIFSIGASNSNLIKKNDKPISRFVAKTTCKS